MGIVTRRCSHTFLISIKTVNFVLIVAETICRVEECSSGSLKNILLWSCLTLAVSRSSSSIWFQETFIVVVLVIFRKPLQTLRPSAQLSKVSKEYCCCALLLLSFTPHWHINAIGFIAYLGGWVYFHNIELFRKCTKTCTIINATLHVNATLQVQCGKTTFRMLLLSLAS